MTKQAQKTQAQPELTSVAQIVEAIAAGKISAADGTTLIAQLSKSSGFGVSERIVRLNKSGGLYIADPDMPASMNVNKPDSLLCILKDESFREQILKYMGKDNEANREKDLKLAREKAAEREAKKKAKA